jgi:hypothetical protein
VSEASELAGLFRALKAPAAARALPALAARAREESWSYERFLEAVLSTEVSSRESHGGESRIKAARLPARKTSSPDWMAAIGWRTRRLSGSTARETKKQRPGDYSAGAVTTAGRR